MNEEEKLIEYVYVIEPVMDDFSQEKLDEIFALIDSAGAVLRGYVTQNIKVITPATYVGKGKLAEMRDKIKENGVNLVVFEGELSPSQTLNIAEIVGVKVIDRTTLILDIFALNAKSSEGKLQVELAQLKYMYPRLKGEGAALSQQGGGIGARGPGETKLETDRRHIRTRIDLLEASLKELETRRKLQTERRKKNRVKTVALVGYTNTGKSTLLNKLTGSDVFVKNQLFATLDPTIRKMQLEDTEICVIDTVGFLKNIPHNLIEAFKSTLETATNADLILNVCDAQGDYASQIETTTATLKELDENIVTKLVVNKCDGVSDFSAFPKDSIFISALTGLGIDELKNYINNFFKSEIKQLAFTFSYKDLNEFMKLKDLMQIRKLEYKDDEVYVEISIANHYFSKIKKFVE